MEEIKEVFWQHGGFLPECLTELCGMAKAMQKEVQESKSNKEVDK